MLAYVNSRGFLYIVALQLGSGKIIPNRNACKLASVLTVQNGDVAQTSAYLSFIKCLKNWKCYLYVHHRHICFSVLADGQNLTFKKCDPGTHQTMKY